MTTTTAISSSCATNDKRVADRVHRVCVVCREAHPRSELIRLVRRPNGRIGWPAQTISAKRVAPVGKGLYVCLERGCLERLLSEKRFKRMFMESMEEECVARLGALLPRPISPSA